MVVKVYGVFIECEMLGLVMSFRNGYLMDIEKVMVSVIFVEMQCLKVGIESGNIDFVQFENVMVSNFEVKGFKKDYCQVVNVVIFELVNDSDKELVLFVVMFMGKICLIDNM